MSERTKEVPKLGDATYVHKYKVHGPYGSNLPCPIGARGGHLCFQGFKAKSVNFGPNPGKQRWQPLATMVHGKLDLVFIHTFCRQTMNIHCIGKFTRRFNSFRHCFLIFLHAFVLSGEWCNFVCTHLHSNWNSTTEKLLLTMSCWPHKWIMLCELWG